MILVDYSIIDGLWVVGCGWVVVVVVVPNTSPLWGRFSLSWKKRSIGGMNRGSNGIPSRGGPLHSLQAPCWKKQSAMIHHGPTDCGESEAVFVFHLWVKAVRSADVSTVYKRESIEECVYVRGEMSSGWFFCPWCLQHQDWEREGPLSTQTLSSKKHDFSSLIGGQDSNAPRVLLLCRCRCVDIPLFWGSVFVNLGRIKPPHMRLAISWCGACEDWPVRLLNTS